jgi:large subunit ribosomal protein L14
MIYIGTNLTVIDNTGAKLLNCLKIFYRNDGIPGSLVITSIKKINPFKDSLKQATNKQKLDKGDLVFGVIAASKKSLSRITGNFLRSRYNSVILLKSKKEKEPLANRVLAPIYDELRLNGYTKIVALSQNIV